MNATFSDEQLQQSRIVLDEFLVQGDEVIVRRDPRGDNSYHNLPPDGTHAYVVGHGTYLHYVDRAHRAGREPGVYRRWGASVCQFEENGETVYRHLTPHALIFADPSIDPQKTRREGTKTWEMCHDGIRIGDLPKLPYYEGDVVLVDSSLDHTFPDGKARIENIEYSWIKDRPEVPMEDRAIYRLTPVYGGFTINAAARQLQLHRRGLFFWYETEPSQHEHFPFEDLLDKVRFYMAIDKAVQLKNPDRGNYGWSVKEVEQALKEGKGALISSHIFSRRNLWAQRGRPTDHNGPLWFYDFPELPELAAECRALTLKAFQEPTDYRYNNEVVREPLDL